ncbi:PREDICTED: voltage-dependent anion-selective channel protein 1-like [Eufriesea mexicana]|uniref:voltage-dependent anion-selective channel protein 1-like n=1 Tax=Eufriesea mexicana TaxID=516756 RepID=UPI00083C1EE8|nr:PREDICTED: voltage-dependent anion-selective channel protein 1-like [Eufriesea mexicana]
MNVPSFSDLGANARDVFTTGYHYGKGLIKLGATARSLGKLKMGSNIQLETETSKMIGNVYAVYKTHNYGSFVQKWVEDGTITLGFRETVMPDVSTKSDISYNPGTAAKKVEVGAKCNKETINAICLVSSDVTSYVNILGSIVTAVKGLLIGYQGGYNSQTKRMTNDVGVAFSYQDVGFHFRCTSIPYEYGLSLLYKVHQDWDAAINGILARNHGVQYWTLGAAAKYNIDEGSTFRCKFNTDLQLGMSLQQKLDEHVTLSLSFNIDCANVTRGGHKFGLAIEIEE